MFKTPESILSLIELLNERKVQLTHACQLKDFKSYIKIAGIPSRRTLETTGNLFTKFASDEEDKTNGVWDKVFGNLQDFGTYFHYAKKGVPTPYGPILIKMNPDVLERASDVAICLRSAGAQGFNRESESLNSLEQVEALFKHSKDHQYPQNIKSKKELEEEDHFKEFKITSSPEMSSTMDQLPFGKDKASLDYITEIIVDPIAFGNFELLNEVKKEAGDFHSSLLDQVKVRHSYNESFYKKLINIIHQGVITFEDLKNQNDKIEDPDVNDLISHLERHKIKYQYDRFAEYYYHGTLRELDNQLPDLEDQKVSGGN